MSDGFAPAIAESVREAIQSTFGMICGDEPTFGGADSDSVACDAIVGVISFVGDPPWSLVLGLPRKTAPPVAAQMVGFEIDYDSADMGDVVGEMANIVAGDALARLEVVGIKAQMGIPTVARGKQVELIPPAGFQQACLQFTSSHGPFWAKVTSGKAA